MNTLQTTKLVDETAGLVFLEGPRWHGGKLWVSDMWGYNVYTIDARTGAREHVVKVAERPSGLAFAKDGTPVIVSMENRKLVKLVGGRLVPYADLSGVATGDCNDMVMDAQGRCYVGNFGYNLLSGEEAKTATLALVDTDGSVRPVGDGLNFPNGAVIMNGGRTLVVAETFGCCLTAFDIAADGSTALRWKVDQDHAAHLLFDPESGLVLTGHHDGSRFAEQMVVRDLASGDEVLRLDSGSPLQSVLFPAAGGPGVVYSCTFSTVSALVW